MSDATSQESARLTVIVLTSDLAVASYTRGAAEQAGADCITALDVASLLRRCAELPAAPLIVVNLETRGLAIQELMTSLADAPVTPSAVIAFGPHVHEAKLQAARDAGCQLVLSKGGFHAKAPELIAQFLAR
jgi:CheY-like chemotaxis protein